MRHLVALAAVILAALALPAVAAADLSITPSTVTVADGTTVTFNATADANSTLAWAFDDNTSAQGTTVSHTFTGVGQHLVTVTESGASSGTATITVTVTAAASPTPYPPALPTGVPPGFKFPLFAARAKPRRMPVGHAAIVASCLWATGACHGAIVLRSTKPLRVQPGRKARAVVLARTAITIAPQTTVTVPVAVPRKLRAFVKHLGRVGAIAMVTVHDDAGNTADDAVTLTLTR
jgi:hypothetical protein